MGADKDPKSKQYVIDRASRALLILGVLNVLSCNLAGVVFLIASGHVGERGSNWIKAVKILCGILVAGCILFSALSVYPGVPWKVNLLGSEFKDPPLYATLPIFAVTGLLHGYIVILLDRVGHVLKTDSEERPKIK